MTPELEAEFQKAVDAARQEGFAEGHAAARRAYCLKAADEMNDMLSGAIRKNKECLQRWANELQRTFHTVDGDVHPYKNQADTP